MLDDESNGIKVVQRPDGLDLAERSLSAGRLVPGLLLIVMSSPVLVVFLSGGAPIPVGAGLKVIPGWAVIALGFVACGVGPLVYGMMILGRREHFSFCRPERRLVVNTHLFGAVFRRRSYPLFEFYRVHIRVVLRPAVFGRNRQFFEVLCEGTAALIGIALCDDHRRARHLAEAIAHETGLTVEDSCGRGEQGTPT